MLNGFSKVYNKVFVTNVVIATLLLSCSINTPNSTTPKKVDLKSNSLTSKPFKINGLSTLKVPFIPKEFSFNNYYGDYIYLKADPTYIRQYGSDCWNGDCTGTWFQHFIPLDGYYHDRGAMYFYNNGYFQNWSYYTQVNYKNLNTEYLEINKKYDLLSDFIFAYFPYYGTNVFSQKNPGTEAYLQATKVDDTHVKISVIAKNLDSGVLQGYYGGVLQHFIQYKLDNLEQSLVMGVTSDELNLNINNNQIGTAYSTNSSTITINSTSANRVWDLSIKGPKYERNYSGVGTNTINFPDGLDVTSLRNCTFTVDLHYKDQPNEKLTQQITVNNTNGDPRCENLTLNVNPDQIGTNTAVNKSTISVNATSDSRYNWILNINGETYNKSYRKTGSQNLFLPDGFHVSILKNGVYNVESYYEDQPDEKVIKTITINNSADLTTPIITDTEYKPYGANVNYNSMTFSVQSENSCQ